MGKHALLSASSSHRWLNCPPSARLCEKYEDTGSEYAQEGTDAHSPVSYTHLDVYKRQVLLRELWYGLPPFLALPLLSYSIGITFSLYYVLSCMRLWDSSLLMQPFGRLLPMFLWYYL